VEGGVQRLVRTVSHGGGLPGFGSFMAWLPDHGVGIISLGNRTYAGWGGTVSQVVEALARTGALQPRVPQPGPALFEARDAVSKLIAAWDDRAAEALAADNLFLDQSRERRRAEFDRLRASHGACRPEGAIEVENALRGEWRYVCDRGELSVTVTLAPTMPPKVQYLSLRSALPLTDTLHSAVAKVTSAIGTPVTAAILEGLVEAPAAEAARADVVAAAPWGTCEVDRVLESDGTSRARVRLACERGVLDLDVAMNQTVGRIARLRLDPGGSSPCLP
jgi:hypothetical protein